MDPYAILKCRSQEQKSSIATGGCPHLCTFFSLVIVRVFSSPIVPMHFLNISMFCTRNRGLWLPNNTNESIWWSEFRSTRKNCILTEQATDSDWGCNIVSLNYNKHHVKFILCSKSNQMLVSQSFRIDLYFFRRKYCS